jgi:hypothetical protein
MVMPASVDAPPEVTLRLATPDDAGRLRTLAQLDSAQVPSGPVLIAEIDGRLLAALPLEGGAPIADPFRRSAGVIQLLRMRAAQLDGGSRSSRRSVLVPRWRRRPGATASTPGGDYALGA